VQAMRTSRRRARWIALGGAPVLVVVVILAALGGRASASSSSANAGVERDAHFWRQLVSTLKPAGEAPFRLRSMADHRLYVMPSGVSIALHFDNMNLAKAKNLNWVAVAVPGTFTRADQARVNRVYGPGFTHFHSYRKDVHAGPAGTKGVWFVHVGTRNFRSPFGPVQRGKVDLRFMPTRPPR
jgi:hypothetical protein